MNGTFLTHLGLTRRGNLEVEILHGSPEDILSNYNLTTNVMDVDGTHGRMWDSVQVILLLLNDSKRIICMNIDKSACKVGAGTSSICGDGLAALVLTDSLFRIQSSDLSCQIKPDVRSI